MRQFFFYTYITYLFAIYLFIIDLFMSTLSRTYMDLINNSVDRLQIHEHYRQLRNNHNKLFTHCYPRQ